LGNEAGCKKHRAILSKYAYILTFIVFSLSALAQTSSGVDKKWEEKAKGYRYLRDRNYKGPSDWYGSSPSSMKDVEPEEGSQGGSNLSLDRLDETREEDQNNNGKGGNLPDDPKTQDPDPITLPDIDAPDIDAPDLPDIDPPTISENFWRVLLIIILAALVIFLIYWFIKNKKPKDKKIAQDFVDLEWNPEAITKTELELRLEEALLSENYREGVRIYFTFILKELIRKNWIHWKKEKTNHIYLLEMSGKPNAYLFAEAVRIYDLVWYGEYEIDKAVFERLQPVLNNYYKMLLEDK
jgi:hypothetical protein